MEAYLSRNQPRWSPTTEADIQAVIDSGALGESHYIDVKQEIAPGSGGRKELARDMASFAIDGGALLLGVAEDKQSREFTLHPQQLEGMVERIEQIANFGIDPPLTVIPADIEGSAQDGAGYVLINIPPSSSAPHMADGKYYGRGERTRRALTDAEIVRLHTKQPAEVRTERLLDQEMGRDPVPADLRRWGHLYLVAQPESGSKSLARDNVRNNFNNFARIVDAGSETLSRNSPYWASSSLGDLQDIYNRANSVALSSYILSGPGRTIRTDLVSREEIDSGVIDIEVRDDGGVRALFSGVTSEAPGFGGQMQRVIIDAMVVASAIRLVRWARTVSDLTGYRGQWLIGIHADGLRGLKSRGWGRAGSFYDEDAYRETTAASTLELEQRPNTVARRLVDRLLDGLGAQGAHQAILAEESDPGQ
jgi:hypothetical protein